jgi:hypothetical protein
MMIKTFDQYINEKEDQPEDPMTADAKISSIFQEIDRNYTNSPGLGSVNTQEILILDERRNWKDVTELAVLGETKKEPGKFYLNYEKGPEDHKIQVDFEFSYKGVENFDVPEPDYAYFKNEKRLGISLEQIVLKKIMVQTDSIKYNSSKISKDLGKTVLRFLMNILKPQFDMVGDEALIIRQL